MIRRVLFPIGRLLLYVVTALAAVAYFPVQVVSPDSAAAMTARVEKWHLAWTHWCLAARD